VDVGEPCTSVSFGSSARPSNAAGLVAKDGATGNSRQNGNSTRYPTARADNQDRHLDSPQLSCAKVSKSTERR